MSGVMSMNERKQRVTKVQNGESHEVTKVNDHQPQRRLDTSISKYALAWWLTFQAKYASTCAGTKTQGMSFLLSRLKVKVSRLSCWSIHFASLQGMWGVQCKYLIIENFCLKFILPQTFLATRPYVYIYTSGGIRDEWNWWSDRIETEVHLSDRKNCNFCSSCCLSPFTIIVSIHWCQFELS